MSQSVVKYGGSSAVKGDTEEEWVTTKKVDIVTTKSVEKKIQRQIVLEDGRVVEEEVPVVTVDTTEDKQTFQTDQDEERELEGGDPVNSKFDGSVLVGDKFTRVKKINDVTESLVKTEALQNIGDVKSKDVKKCIEDRDDIRKYLRSRENAENQIVVAPKVLLNKRNHRVITDQEDVQERNWMNKGKMQNERIKTEEHIEYDSDDSSTSGSSSSSKSSRHKLEPEVYKTRKDENFTEYFKTDKNNSNVKVGEGPHYVSESKEVHRVDDNQLLFTPSRPLRSRNNQRTFLLTDYEPSRRPLNHTDSWLEKHFGSTSSLSHTGSSDLTGSRPGSRDGPGGLRRSASICDIRPVANTSGEFYATVRKSGKVPQQEVIMREKRPEKNYYTENRRSANFSSSGHPVRPPRRQKSSDYGYSSLSRQSGNERHYSSLSFRKQEPDSHPTDKYYFGAPTTVRKSREVRDGFNGGELTRSYSSVQNINTSHQGSQSSHRRPEYYNSTGNIYRSATMGRQRNESHPTLGQRDNNRRDHSDKRYRDSRVVNNRDRSYQESSYSTPRRNARNNQLSQSVDRFSNMRIESPVHYSTPTKDVYSTPNREHKQRYPEQGIERYAELGDSRQYSGQYNNDRNIYSSDRPVYSSIKPVHSSDRNIYSSDKPIYSVPHKIIYDTTSGGSPFTKFRTRIVINSES